MLDVSRCKMRHLQTILAGSTVCFGHNHRQPRTEIFNSRRRSNEGIKRGAIWDFMTGKSPLGNPQIPILLLKGQGEKTPFVEFFPHVFLLSRLLHKTKACNVVRLILQLLLSRIKLMRGGAVEPFCCSDG